MSEKFEVIVIGGGSGGVRLARLLASSGTKTALIEKSALGGTCVNIGCVPKKLFYSSAKVGERLHDLKNYGWKIPAPEFSWPSLLRYKNQEIARLNGIYQKLLHQSGVQIITGTASFISSDTIVVGKKKYTADKIIIATGAKPVLPNIEGANLACVSDDMFFLKHLPKRAVILGGGYIALEFAGILAKLGVSVDLVHRSARLLREFDDQLAQFVMQHIQTKNLKVHYDAQITKLDKDKSKQANLQLSYIQNGKNRKLATDLVLSAIGRSANHHELNLVKGGIKLDAKGKIAVNGSFRTSNKQVYAIGDVISGPQLTPYAIAQAKSLVAILQGTGKRNWHKGVLPTAVFCDPELATVGLTSAQATQQGIDFKLYQSTFNTLTSALQRKRSVMYMSILVDQKTDLVIGLHLAGTGVSEIIQGFAVAMSAKAKFSDFCSTVGVHPTSAEELVTMA